MRQPSLKRLERLLSGQRQDSTEKRSPYFEAEYGFHFSDCGCVSVQRKEEHPCAVPLVRGVREIRGPLLSFNERCNSRSSWLWTPPIARPPWGANGQRSGRKDGLTRTNDSGKSPGRAQDRAKITVGGSHRADAEQLSPLGVQGSWNRAERRGWGERDIAAAH